MFPRRHFLRFTSAGAALAALRPFRVSAAPQAERPVPPSVAALTSMGTRPGRSRPTSGAPASRRRSG